MDEHAYLFGATDGALETTKEVKVRIPIAHLIRLHGLKLLTGQNISDTMTRALGHYFAEKDNERATGATAPSDI